MRAIFHFIPPLFAVGLVLALSACGGWNYTPAAAPAPLAPTEYVVGANDELNITVFGEDDLSGAYTVGANGEIALPLVGGVRVAGQPVSALPGLIADAYRGGYLADPKVSVDVKQARAVFVLGEVNTPGSYPWQAGLSVVNAAALAGGFTVRANQNTFEIIRAGRPLEGRAALSTPLQPGDVLRVKERIF